MSAAFTQKHANYRWETFEQFSFGWVSFIVLYKVGQLLQGKHSHTFWRVSLPSLYFAYSFHHTLNHHLTCTPSLHSNVYPITKKVVLFFPSAPQLSCPVSCWPLHHRLSHTSLSLPKILRRVDFLFLAGIFPSLDRKIPPSCRWLC